MSAPATPKVGFVSLGCPKALVDSERILTQLRMEGYEVVSSYDNADVVVVNTCGFIDSAKAESLDVIGEALADQFRTDDDPVPLDQRAIRLVREEDLGHGGHHQRVDHAGSEHQDCGQDYGDAKLLDHRFATLPVSSARRPRS